MKKKLLFLTLYLHTGGVEKSLLSLLSSLDYRKYEVDLLLFDHHGVLFKFVPPQVNILPPLFDTYSTPLIGAIPELIKARKFNILTGKFLAAFLSRFTKGVGTRIRWEIYRQILHKVDKHYDVAISYLDIFCNYYVTEKVKADKKIVYNHMDYIYSKKSGWPCEKLDRNSFLKSDYIVTVAESSRNSLEIEFPEFIDKIRVIHNTVSPETISNLSKIIPEEAFFSEKAYKILTVARLVDEKGVFLALEACHILVNQGLSLKWYSIGEGSLRKQLEDRISELGMENSFILLGEKENPYPYMRNCNVYVQPSKTEAHCVAVEEAIVLSRPIIVTNIPSFRVQMKNVEQGLIVSPTPDALAVAVKKVINEQGIMTNNITHYDRHKREMDKFYKLIES